MTMTSGHGVDSLVPTIPADDLYVLWGYEEGTWNEIDGGWSRVGIDDEGEPEWKFGATLEAPEL
jgi:hypothetical protein